MPTPDLNNPNIPILGQEEKNAAAQAAMTLFILGERIPQIGETVHNLIHAVTGQPMAFALVVAVSTGPGTRVLTISNVNETEKMITLLEQYLAELKQNPGQVEERES